MMDDTKAAVLIVNQWMKRWKVEPSQTTWVVWCSQKGDD